jgi:hypothetical protein
VTRRGSFRRLLPALLIFVLPVLTLSAQQPSRPPLVRSWTIREVGDFKKIPTTTLRAKMQQRGVMFGVNEPFDQRKVDGTTALLRDLYRETGVTVTVVPAKQNIGPNAVKVEYVVHKQ